MIALRAGSPAGLDERWTAHNYDPLPVTVVAGEGAWVEGDDGRRYVDMLAAYSALNFGHRHPRLVAAAQAQLGRLTLTSRAFYNDQLGAFCQSLCELVGLDVAVPMNTGAEAVETALKIARRWAYEVKGVVPRRANVVAMEGNFHGRTTTMVSISTDPVARDGFAPFTPGFRIAGFGNLDSVDELIDDDTAAVLVEPVQGEAGVIVPAPGYLRKLRQLCDKRGVLLIADEIQSGLGRTGATLACDHDGVVPDLVAVGKALGGGIVPLSAVVGRQSVMEVLTPGSHGSTFGGNPLACAVGSEVVRMLEEGELQERASSLGVVMGSYLAALPAESVSAVRRSGLWAGVDVAGTSGREVAVALVGRGVLAKEAHGRTLRLSPPLVIEEKDLIWAMEQLSSVLESVPASR